MGDGIRAFMHALKESHITRDDDMLEFVKRYFIVSRKSGARALQDAAIAIVNGNYGDKTVKELFTVLNDVVPLVAKDSLIQNIYYHIRKAVKTKYGVHDPSQDLDSPMHQASLTLMRFDQVKWRANRRAYTKRVADGNRRPTRYSFSGIKAGVVHLMKSLDLADGLLLLQICSGARIGEIVYGARFESIGPRFIKQIGVLKAKGHRTVDKPVLFITTDEFIRRFQSYRDVLTRRGVVDAKSATRVIAGMNAQTKKVFNVDDFHSHELRKLYAEMSWRVYGQHMKQSGWTSSVLGHDPDSVQVSTSYMTVDLPLTAEDTKDVIRLAVDPVAVPRNTKSRDGQAFQRMLGTIAALEHNNIKVTTQSLREYGYGAKVIREYITMGRRE